MKKENNIGNEILSDVDKKLQLAMRRTAMELSMEIEIAWERVIDEFYNHYIPKWYDRTYSTYKASSGYSEIMSGTLMPYRCKKEKDGSYLVGITVSSDNIPDNPYDPDADGKPDKDWVFTRTFEKGYHGYNQHEARDWTTRHKGKNSDNRVWTTQARVMKPTPAARMDAAFRKISNQKHVTDVFNKEIAKLF